jgi:H+/Cl- antiporter ClcA
MNDLTTPRTSWKTRAYLIGILGGAFFGFVSAYLYSRAAEEDAARHNGKPQQLPTATIIGVALSALGLARQIAEAGKPRK